MHAGKEKLDGVKRPKTWGGPPLPPLTLGEETFLRLSDGEPNIHGLEGGVDTDGTYNYVIHASSFILFWQLQKLDQF